MIFEDASLLSSGIRDSTIRRLIVDEVTNVSIHFGNRPSSNSVTEIAPPALKVMISETPHGASGNR